MKSTELQKLAVDALNDLKALELTVLDIRKITTIADCMIICSGRSTTHVKSLSENVIKKAKEAHLSYIKVEGQQSSEWIIVDLADVVVHIMLPATREFYKLEDLWEPIKELRESHKK